LIIYFKKKESGIRSFAFGKLSGVRGFLFCPQFELTGIQTVDKTRILSEHGEKQSEELGKYLVKKDFHFDKIFVGPLVRQKKTYEIVADVFSKNKKSIPEPVFIEGLREHQGPKAMRFIFPKLMANKPEIKKLLQAAEENPALKKRNNLL